ncbi:hypothetical protein N510_002391 [Firmicutes bacterium ASF500]|jgi:dipeptidase|nr:hypothetical protein N510_002391 [Firmicutes bacterium ASF500]
MKAWKKLLATVTAVTALTLAATVGASACTTIYVGGNLTEEGTPFVARTEDYGSDMNKLWFISEAGHFKKGDKFLGCPEYGEFEWTFTHDSYRFTYFTNDIYNGKCPECGQENPTHWSYTEFGTNEKGLSVSATETISGNAEVKKIDPNVQEKVDGVVGIEETDIPTILLAEAASAREGIELLAKIYDEYGAFFDSGIFVCDQKETWYIENCSGTQYVAIKLNEDLIFLEPNIAVIGLVDLNDTDNVIASEKLIEVAQQAGTFVGDADKNIIDFRASYANLGTEESPRVGTPRMSDGLKFLDKDSDYTPADLFADNTKFTISNVKDGKLGPFYTNIKVDRKLTKDDVFNYYKLSSIGKPSNQEIEIFQLFKDEPVQTGTVGWVGVGNMSNNVFIPYYPLLLEDQYEGYQVSTQVVTQSDKVPEGFHTWTTRNDGMYVEYPENWRDSFYFTFEGLGGYILYAEEITGKPVSAEDKQYVLDQLSALQKEFYAEFEKMDPKDTTEVGKDMAKRAHEKGLELIDYLLEKSYKRPFTDVITKDWYFKASQYAFEKGFMQGVGDGVFDGGSTLTREMVLQILYVMAGEPAVEGGSFDNLTADDWYANAVNWAAEQGLLAGLAEGGSFEAGVFITREQVAKVLYLYAGSPKAEAELAFTDADSVSAGCLDAMRWAVKAGVINGMGDDTLNPQGTITRAQAAQMLMQFDKLEK